MPLKRTDAYFISAGEHSGDLLGADLVLALKERMPRLSAFGVAGSAMLNAGVEQVASIDEFSVMGVVEIAKRLPALRLLETRLLHWIDRIEPKYAVLIDNPGFHMRFAEQLHMRGIKVFQYVAPKLWAWGQGRAAALRDNFDLVLGILPFEEEFFKTRGIRYTYVGSPLKDRIDKVIISREALGLPKDRPVIACLPGSRAAEVTMNMRTIAAVKQAVARVLPNATFIVPVSHNLTVEEVAARIMAPGEKLEYEPAGSGVIATDAWVVRGIRFVRGMSLEMMAAADAAIVASGTATLECALLGTPLVVIYTMNELTYQVARRAVKIPYVSLVNLMAGKRLVREFIQDFTSEEVAAEVLSLLRDGAKRKWILDSFEDIRDRLKGAAADNAATAIASQFHEPKPTAQTW